MLRLLALSFLFLAAGCDSGEARLPVLAMTAQVGGAPWQADTVAAVADAQTLALWGRMNRVVDGFFCRPEPCEEIGFDVRPAPDVPRRYTLSGASFAYYEIADGDEPFAQYRSVDGLGWLEVELASADALSGVFEVTLVNIADASDTLRITGGRFETRVDRR